MGKPSVWAYAVGWYSRGIIQPGSNPGRKAYYGFFDEKTFNRANAASFTVDLDKQVRQMAQNDIYILTEAGLKLEDIISGHVYLRNINDYKPFNDIYAEFYSKGPGVRTCLMPNSGYEKNKVRASGSFIAARTRSQ